MAFLDETGLAELWSLVRNADVKLATGTYTGTGTYGTNNKNSLAFDFEPKVVIIAPPCNDVYVPPYLCVAVRGQEWAIFSNTSSSVDRTTYGVQVTWSGNTFSWHNTKSADYQLNRSGWNYPYIAIG